MSVGDPSHIGTVSRRTQSLLWSLPRVYTWSSSVVRVVATLLMEPRLFGTPVVWCRVEFIRIVQILYLAKRYG